MANELRVHADLVAGALSGALTSGTTTFPSAGLADLPVIGSTNHAILTLLERDEDGRVTKHEFVKVTAHTSSAISGTVQRGVLGSSAQSWSIGDQWVHAFTVDDLTGLTTDAELSAEAATRASADTTHAALTTTAHGIPAQIQAAIDALLNGAPGALNTLEELAAALGDDPNFATTVLAGLVTLDTRVDALEAAGGSGLALVPVVKIAAYQALANDLVLADASSGTFPVALPVSPNVGDVAGVKKTDGSANPVTITAPVNIDGGTGAALTGPDAELIFIFDGSEWQVLFSTASSVLTANLRTASYALALSDLGGVVEMDVAGANTLTLQPVSSVAWPVNGIAEVFEKGAGQTTLTLGSGVAWATGQTKFKLAGQGASAALRMRAPDIWVASGELVA